jgi:WD40 repeat protein
MRYSGFISYSHAADGRLAQELQHALHRFAKPWYRKRQLRLFRDKTSLSADPGLWSAIVDALENSEWFLLMASSEAASSPWVRKEVEWWIEHRDPMKILIVLTNDDLVWDAKHQDFDWTRTHAVPPELSGKFIEEPLYVDLRWAHDQANLTLRHTQFRAAVLDIAAPLHGKSKDDLDGDDVRQHGRTRTILYSVTMLIAVLAAVATWQAYVATQQRAEAETQRDEARQQRNVAEERRQVAVSRQLAAQSIGVERPDQALLLTLAAMRIRSTQEARDNFVRVLRRFPHRLSYLDAKTQSFAFSRDGTMLATGGMAPALWDLRTQPPKQRPLIAPTEFLGRPSKEGVLVLYDSRKSVSALCFRPDGAVVAGAVGDSVVLWDADTGTLRSHPLVHPEHEDVLALSCQEDGRTVVADTSSDTIVWDLASLSVLRTLPRRATGADRVAPRDRRSSVISSDRQAIAFGTTGGTINVWDLARRRWRGLPFDAEAGIVWSLAFSPDRQTLASGHEDNIVVLWDMRTDPPVGKRLPGALGTVHELAFSPDGRTLVAGTPVAATVWDLTSPPVVNTAFQAHPQQSVVSLAYLRDGRVLASGGSDGSVALWPGPVHVASQTARYVGDVRAIAFSGDGKWLASGGDQGRIVLRSAATGEAIGPPMTPGDKVHALAFSPDSQVLASGGESLVLWNVATQSRIATPHASDTITALAFTLDGRILAAAEGAGNIRFYNGVTGAETYPGLQRPAAGVWSLAFDATGRSLAGGTNDGSIVLWDVDKAEQDPIVLGTHRLRVGQIALAPDGRSLASTSFDGTVAFWDLVARRPILEPTATEQREVTSVAYRPDGKYVAFGSNDGRIAIWSTDLTDPHTLGCGIVNRDLTELEWFDLVGSDVPHEPPC